MSDGAKATRTFGGGDKTSPAAETEISPAARLLSPERLLARRAGESIVLVDIESGNVFELNRTAARLWEELREGATVSEAAERLAREFDVDAATVTADLHGFLSSLQKHGLMGA